MEKGTEGREGGREGTRYATSLMILDPLNDEHLAARATEMVQLEAIN